MTFKEYLKRRNRTATPAGDFTRAALSDDNLPNVKSWDELRSYAERQSNYLNRHAIIAAAFSVWSGYLSANRKLAKRGAAEAEKP